jgi:succinoglycan biosynthesis transport protein ExoP
MDAPSYFRSQPADRLERETVDASSIAEILEQVTGFVRRQFPLFVFILVCSVVLGLVYLITAPPRFTSHAKLLIDSSKLRVLQQQQAPVGDTPVDTAQVETQVEILKSDEIGLSVIKEMHLTDDPEFAGTGGGLLSAIFNLFRTSVPNSESQLTRKALQAFLKNRTISRVGRTYVLNIEFTSLDPSRSAGIANAIADAYIVGQLEAKYQATRRASGWLQDRIKELRTQASVADRAVQEYKEKNNIVDVGGGPGTANGSRLLGEQQLTELNTQLGTARAATAEAKARLERIDDVMRREVPDAAVADSLHNEVITRLRGQYLDLANQEAVWSARYGVSHLATVNLRTQMNEIRRSITGELRRIAESYKSDYEIAKARKESLEQSLNGLVSEAQTTNRDRLGLRELESSAQVYHTIYQNFLQRYMEAIQQQSFPITEARVISAAAPPTQKSSPVTLFVLGIAALLGLVVSFAAATIREAADSVFRATRQVENTLKTHCLAVLPLLQATGSKPAVPGPDQAASPPQAKDRTGIPPLAPIQVFEAAQLLRTATDGPPSNFRETNQFNATDSAARPAAGLGSRTPNHPGHSIETAGAADSGQEHKLSGARLISTNREFMRHVVDEPLSAFAESFRAIKVAADISGSVRENKVIGVTSTLPKEGKSTVSCNLAELIADAGKKVILIDGDLRNPTLTRSLAADAKAGLIEVLGAKVSLRDVIYVDNQTNLSFLPVVIGSRVAHTNEILASAVFRQLIDDLRKTYDYIVIDFPPIAPVVDVRAVTQIVDSFIYVVEWGRTRMNLVQHQLASSPELQERLLGVVLNKANVKVLQRYETYYGRNYYKKYYGRYGYTS